MNLIKHIIPIGFGRNDFTIRHITDVHDGHVGFHRALFEKFMRIQERDKHSWWIATGDLIDADRPSTRDRKSVMYADRRDALSHEDEKTMDWLDSRVIPKYRRIKDRCLGILDGDHYVLFSSGMTSGQYIARKAGVPYLGERMAFVGMCFTLGPRHVLYTILARHGKGGGSSHGADLSQLERQGQGFIADLHLGGHTHKSNLHHVTMLYPNRTFDGVRQKIIWYVRGGSFLRGFLPGHQTYAEAAEYGPLSCGWAEIHVTVSRSKSSTNNAPMVTETSARLVVA